MKPPIILFADDDPEDRQNMLQLIQGINPDMTVISFQNGLELINHVCRMNDFAHELGCIILDINMPLWDGIKTLQMLKAERHLEHIPVVVLSTSNSRQDIDLALRSGACAYISKPVAEHEWLEVKRQLDSILLNLNTKGPANNNVG